MSARLSKKTKKLSVKNREDQQTFEAAIGWTEHLGKLPLQGHVPNIFAHDPYAAAVRLCGLLWVNMLINLAKTGHAEAIRTLVNDACEMVEAIEEICECQPDALRERAARRADWPVMLCRNETASKLVAAYLDALGLGRDCVINADGAQVAKYSLRTPINRFVWRQLKWLRVSIELTSDVPEVAAIDLDALPKLTKATAKIWADKALVPYIFASYPDFTEVSEFTAILKRPGVKTPGQQRREIRKDVIRALQSLAPAS